MDIIQQDGLSIQTFGCWYTVWYFSGGRLIEVAQFVDLADAIRFVDAAVEYDLANEWLTTYTILDVSGMAMYVDRTPEEQSAWIHALRQDNASLKGQLARLAIRLNELGVDDV